jgi:pimeloyl-ACP methyl ester carboxylesterase
MNNIERVFIHGLEGSSTGTKGTFFRGRYPGMIIGDYEGTLDKRMEKLTADLEGRNHLILVGSSFGGLMAAIFACTNKNRIHSLVLLAPALAYADFGSICGEPLVLPVTLYQGSDDTVVLPEPTREVAENLFKNLDYRLVKDDHSLLTTFTGIDWDSLLAVERS